MIKDLTGQRFGRLVVLKQDGFTEKNKHNSRYAIWLCKCDCGNYCRMDTGTIKRKGNHSCGCLAKEHLRNMTDNNITQTNSQMPLPEPWRGDR